MAADDSGRASRAHGRRSDTAIFRTAIEDQTRLAYSEILDDEQAITAAGFWQPPAAWFAAHGVTVEPVLTDNGSRDRSNAWRDGPHCARANPETDPPLPAQNDGKVQRFHRILLEGWP